jgi:hypothetical protein
VQFSLLVNGSPTCFFSSSRGLRQWDSLSSLLFVVVMEALGMMILAVASGGLLFAFLWGHCRANPNHLCNLRSLFILFEVVLGLKTNLAN